MEYHWHVRVIFIPSCVRTGEIWTHEDFNDIYSAYLQSGLTSFGRSRSILLNYTQLINQSINQLYLERVIHDSIN